MIHYNEMVSHFNLASATISCRSSKKKSFGLSSKVMATLLPPASKRARLEQSALDAIDLSTVTGNVLCQFKASDTGEITGTTIRIPARTTAKELELLLNQLLNNVSLYLP